jgi:hypothetical protein
VYNKLKGRPSNTDGDEETTNSVRGAI